MRVPMVSGMLPPPHATLSGQFRPVGIAFFAAFGATILYGFVRGGRARAVLHLRPAPCIPEEEQSRPAVPRVELRHVEELERFMDELSSELGPLENFILPGGALGAAHLHVARTVCRRAERSLVALAREEAVGEWTLRYLNRRSDALFVMSRYENLARGVGDVLWDSRA